ncbi:unnamed protein product [Spirodela intermedia]|uniref:DDT domain-containing protein n=1 Tax=Spirodela intermedia TaxID=51605 RepID=A0A7I8KK59_SPIIN|nr:unnamed protein product [Spirodela intermedia]
MAVPTDSPAKKQIAAARAGTKRKQPPSCTSEGKALAFQAPAGSVHAPAPKQNKSPGVRLVGGRIYDSEHGKTCHQCRQKTMDFAAACSNSRSLKPCRIHFCHKCLLNRKKRGQQPTGILIHAAKAIGCSSVSEMLRLHHTSSESKRVNKDENATPDNPPSSVEKTVASERKRVMGNSRGSKGSLEFDRRASELMEEKTAVLESVKRNVKGENGSGPASDLRSAVAMPQGTELIRDADIKLRVETDGLLRDCKEMKHVFTSTCAPPDSVLVMPKGTALITVAGIEFQVEDVGPVLQFLEFCSAFGKLLDIKEGQPESILRELASGRGVRRGLNSKIVQLYIKLLSRIREERGDRSLSCTENDGTWLKALQKCVAEAQFDLDDLDLDSVTKCTAGYATLDSSKKLRLLNFLCDELLGTKEVRSLINTENTNFDEKNKEEREKLLAANEEKKILKKKLKDEVAEAMLELRNGAPLTVSEHEDLISKIKTELEKAHAEV